MGQEIEQQSFAAEDFERFRAGLDADLERLARTLARPGFGEGPRSIGAELEVHLVDRALAPSPVNEAVQRAADDARIALELNRYNLELNTRPVAFAGSPFAGLRLELEDGLGVIRRAAARAGAQVAVVGILPTLRPADVGLHAMTDRNRYRALSDTLRALRGLPFAVRIDGRESLRLRSNDVTIEGANTSLQIHLRVSPAEFARTYNAAQLAAAPVLAAACNSPFLLGRRLWDETRIALFQDAVDARAPGSEGYRAPRVSFGHGWIHDALDLFRESVALHAPLLPVVSAPRDLARERPGDPPALASLRIHHGTVWTWNRAIYDPSCGGHLRIEMRSLPAGPTVLDMCANAAFAIGLTLGLAPTAESLTAALPFELASRSFFAAARHGLDAEIVWPTERAPSPETIRAGELVHALLPVAERGLVAAGVEPDEARTLLGIVRERVERRQTGTLWMDRALERAHPRDRDDALREVTARYLELSSTGAPVHTWPRD